MACWVPRSSWRHRGKASLNGGDARKMGKAMGKPIENSWKVEKSLGKYRDSSHEGFALADFRWILEVLEACAAQRRWKTMFFFHVSKECMTQEWIWKHWEWWWWWWWYWTVFIKLIKTIQSVNQWNSCVLTFRWNNCSSEPVHGNNPSCNYERTPFTFIPVN